VVRGKNIFYATVWNKDGQSLSQVIGRRKFFFTIGLKYCYCCSIWRGRTKHVKIWRWDERWWKMSISCRESLSISLFLFSISLPYAEKSSFFPRDETQRDCCPHRKMIISKNFCKDGRDRILIAISILTVWKKQ
jgi:hypothetical protein